MLEVGKLGSWEVGMLRTLCVLEFCTLGIVGNFDLGIWDVRMWEVGNMGTWECATLGIWSLGMWEFGKLGSLKVGKLGS